MYINYTHLFSLFICFFLSKSYQVTTFQSRAPCALVEEGLDLWLHSGWWRLELRYHRSARRTSVGWEGHGAQKLGGLELIWFDASGFLWNWWAGTRGKVENPKIPWGIIRSPIKWATILGVIPQLDLIPHSQGFTIQSFEMQWQSHTFEVPRGSSGQDPDAIVGFVWKCWVNIPNDS